ncbi:MAG: hypothetical protein JRJ68_02280 [Deltaproteobacteria bacterium]|nr:hypothetical protein [Deltaproteobacteria bacterium]
MRHLIRIIAMICIAAALTACNREQPVAPPTDSCTECHQLELDKDHKFPCISCHKGDDTSRNREEAHLHLIRQPAHPDNMKEGCGSCHGDKVTAVLKSTHFTLKNSTNLFRKTFGAVNSITSFLDTPRGNNPTSILDLADDLLRRRCFRCHPYTGGDTYPAVNRGTGCAACHLSFYEGKMRSHSFIRPKDDQCLSCHYGNYVGFDYYGRFEQDFNDEYRTPYTTGNKHFRPFGVEYHQLLPDIHQQKGMVCIDCHSGEALMTAGKQQISCEKCHLKSLLDQQVSAAVEKKDGGFIFHAVNGAVHTLPIMKNGAHFVKRNDAISCQVCHAQWTFGDYGKHFLRSDIDDFDQWYLLATQGSSELEKILTNNADFENDELPPAMSDKITGSLEPGLWYKGFTMRRWENVLLGRDGNGTITTVRPVLDYKLSWIDADETIRFDSVSPGSTKQGGLRPYTPHTTGKAGLFYNERIRFFIEIEKMQAN